MIEAAMVRLGKGDDEFVWPLIARDDFDASFADATRVHHGYQLVEQRRFLFE
jgi:hypothetical protein